MSQFNFERAGTVALTDTGTLMWWYGAEHTDRTFGKFQLFDFNKNVPNISFGLR